MSNHRQRLDRLERDRAAPARCPDCGASTPATEFHKVHDGTAPDLSTGCPSCTTHIVFEFQDRPIVEPAD